MKPSPNYVLLFDCVGKYLKLYNMICNPDNCTRDLNLFSLVSGTLI